MQTNFGRTIKRFLILAVCAVVLSGGISAFLLRTQIGEIASYVWQEEVRDEWQEGTLESDGLHGEDFWREEERTDLAKVITRPSAAAIAAACVTGVILLLAGAVYWLLVAAWLYQAAVLAKMHGMVWFLLGLCGNLAAVPVFLLLRSLIRKKCGGVRKLSAGESSLLRGVRSRVDCKMPGMRNRLRKGRPLLPELRKISFGRINGQIGRNQKNHGLCHS